MNSTYEKPNIEVVSPWESWEGLQKHIERVARTCYRSERSVTDVSWRLMVGKLLDRGHEAMLEHASFSVFFDVDRGVTHEAVRHRVASFAQESTRYVNYDKRGIRFIDPRGALELEGKLSAEKMEQFVQLWWLVSQFTANAYEYALENIGATPQMARLFLPNGLMARLVITANIREWRHILRLRTAKDAHPAMREAMLQLLGYLSAAAPMLFGDIMQEVQEA